MLRIFSVLFLTIFLISSLSFSNNNQKFKFNYKKINANIKKLVDEILAEDEDEDQNVESLSILFDDKYTDISNDKFKLLLGAKLKELAWNNNNPAEINMAFQLAKFGETEEDMYSDLSFDFGVSSDIINLIKQFFKEAVLKELSEKAQDTETCEGDQACLIETQLAKDLIPTVEAFNEVTNVKQLYAKFIGASAEAILKLQESITRANEAISNTEDALLQEELRNLIDDFELAVKVITQIKIVTDNAATRISIDFTQAIHIILQHEGYDSFLVPETSKIALEFTNQKLLVTVGCRLHSWLETYLEMKEALIDWMRKLQANKELEELKMTLKVYYEMVKQIAKDKF